MFDKAIAQRGNDYYLVKKDENQYYIVDISTGQQSKIEVTPDVFYRAGYWKDPDETFTQLQEALEKFACFGQE